MNLTIRLKLYGLGLLGALTALTVGLAGIRGISKIHTQIEDIDGTSYAVRPHVEGAAFLDLTRNDVSRMLTSSGPAQENAAAELAEHGRLLSERLATTIKNTRDPQIRAAFEAEKKSADEYLLDVSKITEGRGDITKVAPLVGGLLQKYQDLRGTMDASNDKLEAASKKSDAQAQQVVRTAEVTILAACLVAWIFIILIAVGTTRDIDRRLGQLIHCLKQLASGDLTLEVRDTKNDELGEIARWFGDSVGRLRKTISQVASSAHGVTGAAEELQAVSDRIGRTSEETTTQANDASTATAGVSQNLQSVVAATGLMNTSIEDITRNVREASSIAKNAVEMAESTTQLVTRLSASSAQIGQVVKLIISIAEKTNLLALNATIEAARAGEAGRGFAVVAGEVKDLARQTAVASEDIRSKIQAIQADGHSSADAIAGIRQIIHQIHQISLAVASAVEQQHSTTSEISQNISEGARSSSEVARNISGVALSAQGTSRVAQELQTATGKLESMSDELKALVEQFHYEAQNESDAPGSTAVLSTVA
jgi:methyl-accepting chemotaxis protein